MVDLGENCSLELSDIREITEHFLELPFQVFNLMICFLVLFIVILGNKLLLKRCLSSKRKGECCNRLPRTQIFM